MLLQNLFSNHRRETIDGDRFTTRAGIILVRVLRRCSSSSPPSVIKRRTEGEPPPSVLGKVISLMAIEDNARRRDVKAARGGCDASARPRVTGDRAGRGGAGRVVPRSARRFARRRGWS